MKNQTKICLVCKEKRESQELFTCKRCAKEFHIECNYYTEDDVRTNNIEYCDYCRIYETLNEKDKEILSKKPSVCKICLKTDGILKRFKDKSNNSGFNWIHPTCLKWFFSIKLIFENTLSIASIDKFSEIPSETWMAECDNCKKTLKDGRIKCTKKNCNKYFHLSCLQSLSKKNNNNNFEVIKMDRIEYMLYTCNTCSESIKSSINDSSHFKTFGKLVNSTSDSTQKPTTMIKIDTIDKNKEEHCHSNDKIIFKNHQLQTQEKKDSFPNYFKIRSITNNNPNLYNNENSSDKVLNIYNDNNKLTKNKPTNYIKKNYQNKERNNLYNLYQKTDINLEDKNFKAIKKKKKINTCFVVTNFKCDICALEVDVMSGEGFIKCEECQKIYNHIDCLKRFNMKLDNYLCLKCSEDKKDKYRKLSTFCFICGKSYGTMIKCGNLYVHVLCYQFFPKNFTKRIDSSSIAYDGKLKCSTCNLCKFTSGFTYKCQNCNINFHPYCGYLHDFKIYSQKLLSHSVLKYEYYVFECDNHFYYLSKEDKLNDLKRGRKEIQSLQLKKNNQANHKGDSNKRRLNKIKKNRSDNYDYLENINSFNYSKLKKIFLKKKYLESAFKLNEFDWEYTEPFLRFMKNEEIECYKPCEKFKVIINLDDMLENQNPNPGFLTKKNSFIISLLKYKNSSIIVSFAIKDEQNNIKNNLSESIINRIDFLGKKINREEDNENNDIFENDFCLLKSNINDKIEPKNNIFSNNIKLQSFIALNTKEEKEFRRIEKELNLLRNRDKYCDIDIELFFLKNEYQNQLDQNKNMIKKYKESITNSNVNINPIPQNSEKVLKTFRSLQRYSFLRKRIKSGFMDKKECIDRSIVCGKSIKKCIRDDTLYKNNNFICNEKLKTFETDCCVCMNSDIDDINPIVFCDSCNVSIHPECYGIKEIPAGDYYCEKCTIKNKTIAGKIELNLENEKISSRLERNKIEELFKQIICCICERRNGALKKIDLGNNDIKWCHIVCVLFSKSFCIKDYEKMEIHSSIKSTDTLIELPEKCEICLKNNGEIFKCINENCHRKFHILCAYFEGFKLQLKDGSENKLATTLLYKFKNIICEITCDKHSEVGRDQETQKRLRERYYHKEFEYYKDSKNIFNKDILMNDLIIDNDNYNEDLSLTRNSDKTRGSNNYIKENTHITE